MQSEIRKYAHWFQSSVDTVLVLQYYLLTVCDLHWWRYWHTSPTFIPPPGGELLCFICVCTWKVGVWVSKFECLPSPPRCVSTHTQLVQCRQWQAKLNKYCRLVNFSCFHWCNRWQKLNILITHVHIHIFTTNCLTVLLLRFLLNFLTLSTCNKIIRNTIRVVLYFIPFISFLLYASCKFHESSVSYCLYE